MLGVVGMGGVVGHNTVQTEMKIGLVKLGCLGSSSNKRLNFHIYYGLAVN